MNSKTKGDISESAVLFRLTQLGYTVLLPWGDNERYDLVVHHNDKFHRVQVKTARYKNGCVVFWSSSVNQRKRVRESYIGQIEYFAVYCLYLDKVYIVPINEACQHETSLRVADTKNNQDYGVRWAKDYELSSASLV